MDEAYYTAWVFFYAFNILGIALISWLKFNIMIIILLILNFVLTAFLYEKCNSIKNSAPFYSSH